MRLDDIGFVLLLFGIVLSILHWIKFIKPNKIIDGDSQEVKDEKN